MRLQAAVPTCRLNAVLKVLAETAARTDGLRESGS
jgi:hypothetical protein